MVHVVAYEVFKSGRLVRLHGIKCDLVQVVFVTRLLEDVNRGDRRHVKEMQIIRTPELDQIKPRFLKILLRAYPAVLLVTWKNEFVRKLRPHKTLMIVVRGIDQMAQNLDWRPIIGSWSETTLFRRDFSQPRSCIQYRGAEILEKLVKAVLTGHLNADNSPSAVIAKLGRLLGVRRLDAAFVSIKVSSITKRRQAAALQGGVTSID
jgi:hypothetical protein